MKQVLQNLDNWWIWVIGVNYTILSTFEYVWKYSLKYLKSELQQTYNIFHFDRIQSQCGGLCDALPRSPFSGGYCSHCGEMHSAVSPYRDCFSCRELPTQGHAPSSGGSVQWHWCGSTKPWPSQPDVRHLWKATVAPEQPMGLATAAVRPVSQLVLSLCLVLLPCPPFPRYRSPIY